MKNKGWGVKNLNWRKDENWKKKKGIVMEDIEIGEEIEEGKKDGLLWRGRGEKGN